MHTYKAIFLILFLKPVLRSYKLDIITDGNREKETEGRLDCRGK